MNILFAPAHYYLADGLGTEMSWPFYAMKVLAEKGHTVHAICGYADLTGTLPENVHLTVIFPGKRGRNALQEYRRKLYFYRRVAIEVRRIRAQHKIDVVHHFAPISAQSPNISAVKGELKDLPFTIGPAMVPASKGSGLDLAMGVNLDWRLRLTSVLLGIISAPAFWLHKKTLQAADRIMAATEDAATYYRQFVDPKKVVVEPAGISIEVYEINGKKHNHNIILSVCYLIPRKGIDVLIKAFTIVHKKHPQARLWIVGNGTEEENLRAQAKAAGLGSAVHFWGFVNNTEVGRYYAEAGIFASPTRHEPFGQTLLEAMAAGLPVVASHTGAVPKIISKEVGFTHPVDDVTLLAARLDQLLSNPSLIEEMSKKAKERVKKYYSWSVIMDHYVAIWQELLK